MTRGAERMRPLKAAHMIRTCMYAVVFANLGAAVFAAPSPLGPINPSTVERMIEKYGARLTVETLTNSRPKREFGDYGIVLSGVSSGDRRWIALVPKLRTGTDAATAEALIVSVAEALPRNPRAVLRLIKIDPAWRHVCTYPMIEPTRAEERAYFKETIPAVKSVRDPNLQSAKRACLANLVNAQRR